MRRGRLRFAAINDNREPAERRLLRYGFAVGVILVVAAVAVLVAAL
jgi:hypothetical protein